MKKIENINFIDYIQSNNLRKNTFTTILVFVALFLMAETVYSFKEAISYKNMNGTYIDVKGYAEEYIKPDTLTFNISINEEGKNTQEATEKVSNKANKAIKILTDNGINKDDIKLTSYNISDKYAQETTDCARVVNVATPSVSKVKLIAPKLESASSVSCHNTESKIVGQNIYQTMEVRIRDIDKNADNDKRTKIIDELSKENIKADNFTFTVYDIESVKKEIRSKAIEKAKQDAKKLAKDLNKKVVELSSFTEGDNNRYFEGGYAAKSVSMTDMASSIIPAPELTPGQQKITTTVTLTYLMR